MTNDLALVGLYMRNWRGLSLVEPLGFEIGFEIDTLSRLLYIMINDSMPRQAKQLVNLGRRLERVVYTPASP
jgi:hypothetical protein